MGIAAQRLLSSPGEPRSITKFGEIARHPGVSARDPRSLAAKRPARLIRPKPVRIERPVSICSDGDCFATVRDAYIQLLAVNNTRLWVFSPGAGTCSGPVAMIGNCDEAQGSNRAFY